MGNRKRQAAQAIKEAKKSQAFAKLNNCPTSPRKMRLVADQVRGEDVNKALAILRFSLKRLLVAWRNCCCLPWPIGKQKMKMLTSSKHHYTLKKSVWTVEIC